VRDALLLLLALGAGAGLWSWSARGRERVRGPIAETCAELGLQRLDDSVVLHGLRLLRTAHGWRLGRIYRFEFTLDGSTRHVGDVGLAGEHPVWVRVGHPQGDIHIDFAGRGGSRRPRPDSA
jgi:hypothetical protein